MVYMKLYILLSSVCFLLEAFFNICYIVNWFCCCCSAAQSCQTVCDPMDCSKPGLSVPHHLLKFAKVRVHCIGDSVQLSHPLMPSSSSALSLSQHQGLFQWVSCSHQMTKILEFQPQHQSFQRIFRVDFFYWFSPYLLETWYVSGTTESWLWIQWPIQTLLVPVVVNAFLKDDSIPRLQHSLGLKTSLLKTWLKKKLKQNITYMH